jgi:hypothetical protein
MDDIHRGPGLLRSQNYHMPQCDIEDFFHPVAMKASKALRNNRNAEEIGRKFGRFRL